VALASSALAYTLVVIEARGRSVQGTERRIAGLVAPFAMKFGMPFDAAKCKCMFIKRLTFATYYSF
jgi:hypothetical protein